MKNRPLSVTSISTLILIIYALHTIFFIYTFTMGVRFEGLIQKIIDNALFGEYGYHALCVIDTIVMSTCAIAMLYGKNWARITYIVVGFITILIDPVVLSHGVIVPTNQLETLEIMIAIIFSMIVITLFNISVAVLIAPKAQSYFSNTKVKASVMKRPVLVSILCWLIIVLATLSASILWHHNSILFRPILAQQNFMITILFAILPFVGAMGMLYAKKWGRTIYIAYWIIALLHYALGGVDAAIFLQLVGLALVLLILFSKKARAYFNQKSEPIADQTLTAAIS